MKKKKKKTTSKQMSSTNSMALNTPSMVDTSILGDGASACAYASLGTYNMRNPALVSAPIDLSLVPSQRVVAVPLWGSFGYNSLSHGRQGYNCSGYYTITGAYPDYSKNCGRYARRACAGTTLRGLGGD